ncbi:hypothetical protein PsYK624_141960 [Phanerochaete sordida]|uniref:Uncharacterized protein n=1 Tax=Phanerochaete sordida TaxID=48140 RepID=A0A9P3LKS5_9APHY|nr:hypothetical protein PsYK624_141960 [Phanerochaete sordida]
MMFAPLLNVLLAVAALAAGLPSLALPESTQSTKMCSDLGKSIIPIPQVGVWNGTRQIGYLSILPSSVYGAGYSISPTTTGALTGVYLCGNPTIANPTILSGSNALNFSILTVPPSASSRRAGRISVPILRTGRFLVQHQSPSLVRCQTRRARQFGSKVLRLMLGVRGMDRTEWIRQRRKLPQ